jgi:lipopolysaccharide/colanic/teichoic acid biosynthesis glycosyltransferase
VSFLIGLIFSPEVGVGAIGEAQVRELVLDALIFSSCVAVSSYINGYSYSMFERSQIDFVINAAVSVGIGCLVSVIVNYVFRYSFIGRWVYGIAGLTYIVTVYLSFAVFRGHLQRVIDVVILGDSNADSVFRSLEPITAVSKLRINKLPLNSVSNIKRVFDGAVGGIYYIIVSSNDVGAFKIIDSLNQEARRQICTTEFVVENELSLMAPASIIWDKWWEVPTSLRGGGYSSVKRIFDLLLVGILALPAAILISVAAILIKLEDGGPVFYRQTRFGQFRLRFEMFKLRSMGVESEKHGAQWASVNDRRVTTVGRILRKTRIDELPQLWNILKGEMSMIGPRPERPELYEEIEKTIPKFGLRLSCKPGLTGWAQVNYPYGASVEDARNKLLYDMFYIVKADLLFELRIVSRTIVAMFRGAR